MGIARSTYYGAPRRAADDTALVEAMHGIKDEFEAYGCRPMRAALGQRGSVVNHKKLKRLMREHGLSARVGAGTWRPPTAITTSRSSRIERKT